MNTRLDWQHIFEQCRVNIQKAIDPCLKTRGEAQPNLGIGAGGDFMKPADLASETAIVETLKDQGVSFTLISEESGIREYGVSAKDCYLTVDPIDGTTNLTRRLPFYCTSIAVSSTPYLADVYAGMVADLVHDQTYSAFIGEGAFCNNEPIHTSKAQMLHEACVGLDLNAYKTDLTLDCRKIIQNIKHTRHFGANALEICYVAGGITDAFIDLRGKIRTTDVAAGFLIAKEAGATITDQTNQPINVPLDPKQTLNFVASANIKLHRQILSLIGNDV
ncbi:MAG: D-fructose 1,6-bisphosphatase [Nitrososphaerota archaeon]|jgi:myo-inositol-1(or 4)-monophosphatase|uniref:inositol monophosphatase family protein n=1 Tax=Candidatus Bathycorpusculum sp. TaxID=2994959 RepID=UPI00281F8B1C|nr:D-fructose 1,6-bisphosphatase [Candidatus Termitimicrobium sp.]MCL2431874.1 D-fructose 1,6-bisphosphatase [Candidatus Termitimicrobium sp.]MDR0493011.1 D-fructose 1,6-bisphosphatase [Nitrososphaerota archaeon]